MKQEMMKGKQRVKGTVLVTVVTVMLVMVLFLMSTLILTTSANRRSYYSYYQTQAQYAAQAAIDAITNNAYSDEGFYKWVEDEVHNVGDKGNIYVTFDGSSLGLNARDAEGNDLIPGNAKLPTVAGTSNSVQNPDQTVWCEIERVTPNYIWDEETGMVYEQEAWKVTATAHVGSGRNRTSYSMVNHIYKNVKAPLGQDRSNTVTYKTIDYTRGSSGGSTGVGGSMLKGIYTLGSSSGKSAGHNISTFGPEISDASRIPVGRLNYGKANTPTLNAQNGSVVVGNGEYVNNYKNSTTKAYVFQSLREHVIVYGDYVSAGGDKLAAYSTLSGIPAEVKYKQDLNYFYVDGTLTTGQLPVGIGFKVGVTKDAGGNNVFAYTKGSLPVNLYAGAVKCDEADNAQLAVNGDAFLYDPQLESVIAGTTPVSHLARFTYNNVSAAEYKSSNFGNLYCNNKKLRFWAQAQKEIKIDGDLVYTNPNGTIEFQKGDQSKITIGGNFLTASANVPWDDIQATGFKCQFKIENGTAKKLVIDKIEPDTPENRNKANAYITAGYTDDYHTAVNRITGLADNAKVNYSLFPFNFRLDEIFDNYYRWDLQTTTEHTDGSAYTGNDPLIKESQAAGHVWKWKKFTETRSAGTVTTQVETTPEFYHEFKAGSYDSSSPEYNLIQQYGKGQWWTWPGDFGDGYHAVWTNGQVEWEESGGVRIVKNNTTLNRAKYEKVETEVEAGTSLRCCVPYTTATKNSSFIKHYEPADPGLSHDKIVLDTTNYYDSYSALTDSTAYPEAANELTLKKADATVYYHDDQGTAKTDTVNAYIVNQSGTIKLSNYQNETLYIDPKSKARGSTKPLVLVFEGDPNGGQIKPPNRIIINNTATSGEFNEDETAYTGKRYDATTTPTDKGVNPYAGRQEVLIFFKKGLQTECADSAKMEIFSSGTYGMFSANPSMDRDNPTFDVISNPQYPGYWEEFEDETTGTKDKRWVSNSVWRSWLPNSNAHHKDLYKYEYMPNTIILGEAGAEYNFGFVPIMNAEILMPKSDYYCGTTNKNYDTIPWYREEYNSVPRVGKETNSGDGDHCYIAVIGTVCARNLDLTQNWSSILYIGDANRTVTNNEYIDVPSEDLHDSKAPNASDGNDFFNNNYLGAN